jgi:prepilin-type N-terminal cleavage/methylation domain-containing protein
MAMKSKKAECLLTCSHSNEKGLTLVELLVVMAIGAILAISVVAMFINQTRAMALNEDLVDLEQNLRVAMDMLHRDVRMSGAYVRGAFPAFVIGGIDYDDDGVDELNSDGGGTNPDAIMMQYSPDSGLVIETYNGAAKNLQLCRPSGLTVGQVIAGSSVDSPPETRSIEVTSVGPISCPGSGCAGNNCDKINFSPGGSFYNTPGGLAGDYEEGRLWNNLQTLTYFISSDANGDGTSDDPALMRVLNRSAPAIVAFGVTDLQVVYRDIAGTATTTLADIRRVELSLTGETRNEHNVGTTPAKRSRTMTTEILVRNLTF